MSKNHPLFILITAILIGLSLFLLFETSRSVRRLIKSTREIIRMKLTHPWEITNEVLDELEREDRAASEEDGGSRTLH
jgi:hypothetical protein